MGGRPQAGTRLPQRPISFRTVQSTESGSLAVHINDAGTMAYQTLRCLQKIIQTNTEANLLDYL